MNKKIAKEEKIILCILIISIVAIIGYIERESIIKFYHFFKDREAFKSYVESFGYLSWFIFFLFQVVQVVIFFIPGEIIQATGGYIFGTVFGTVLSFLGIGAGSYILFKLGERFGRNFVRKVVSEKTHDKFEKILQKRNGNLIVFLIYLMPGFPKDSLALICGITEMNAKDYMKWSMLGRIPALTLCSYFGANINSSDRNKAIVVVIISLIIGLFVYLFKGKIMNKIKKFR